MHSPRGHRFRTRRIGAASSAVGRHQKPFGRGVEPRSPRRVSARRVYAPPDAFQTSHDNQRDQVLWMLKVKADVPGVDYSDEFELPVFRTSSSPSAPATFSGGTQIASFAQTTTMPSELSAEVSEPPHHRVFVTESPDGLQFHFPAGRNVARTVPVVSLAVAISAFFFEMFRVQPEPPKFAFAVVGLLDFFLILAVIHSALSATRIVAGNGAISWRRSVLGIGQTHELQISEVDSILTSTGIQQGSSTLYSVILKSKSGKKYILVDDIESRQEARWIVWQIEKRAGLGLNTQVEINNSVYGPPPPPDGSSFPDGGVRATSSANKKWSQAVGAIFFVGWLSFIGYMMLRVPRMRESRSVASAGTTRAGPETGGAQPFVRTTAVKQASLVEVLAWPPQQQAEELMARAVEHDSDAAEAI